MTNGAQGHATQDTGTHQPWVITLGELDEKLGVRVHEQSAERVVASMPVAGNRQSLGRLHGGATLALAEAVGSWAAVIHASTMGKSAVGVDVSATHHKSVRDGQVTATATALSLGRTMTCHMVTVTDEDDRRLATVKITNYLLDTPVHNTAG
ncbi:MAG: thioesterase [Micrococcales bacterium]|nr:MAG: thioesterase [Micrococcales bacterium]